MDSSSTDTWTCFSFTSGGQVDAGWDLAWQNWDTVLTALGGALVVTDQDFDELSDVPETGWSEGDIDAMDDWYIYDGATHVLTPKNHIYVIRDAAERHWKLQITTYYSSSGDLHQPTFRWAPLGE